MNSKSQIRSPRAELQEPNSKIQNSEMSYLFVVIGVLLLFFLAVFWTVFAPCMDETTITPSSKAIDYDLLDEGKKEGLKARMEEEKKKVEELEYRIARADNEQKERIQKQCDNARKNLERLEFHSDLLEIGFTKEKVLKGRKIYMREGCYFCHTMQVRKRVVKVRDEETKEVKFQIEPIPADKLFATLGEPSQPGDYVYDKPHLLGTERTGPDLFYEGLKREISDPKDPNDPTMVFHKEHFIDPRSKEAASLMPSFNFLSEEELEALTIFISIPRE